MITVKEAVKIAKNTYLELFEDSPSNESSDLQLEEIQLDTHQNEWQVTLGFNAINTNPLRGIASAIALGGDRLYTRKYKLFHIDADTGAVRSMKIREV